ncbi:hypothetical protein BIW11_05659 [Tropilaelaps mercedesae]|uniref:Uncharacterized protein n=1 Tax=Tropilaelaps mercedesae TaxID=418985 RepID=A0A1V9Y1E3_9ACAR|nr:hypothetical protein BIW11_05659 [Tropilaelaps mercedesae]
MRDPQLESLLPYESSWVELSSEVAGDDDPVKSATFQEDSALSFEKRSYGCSHRSHRANMKCNIEAHIRVKPPDMTEQPVLPSTVNVNSDRCGRPARH